MPKDINKTTHLGTAASVPTLTYDSNNKPKAIFTLKVIETWEDGRGVPKSRENLFRVEVKGKKALSVQSSVKLGKRYLIDGYLRSDIIHEKEQVCIVVFHMEEVLSGDEELQIERRGYKEGLRQALKIASTTEGDDVKGIRGKLEILISSL